MFSTGIVNYAQIADIESPTGIATYTWKSGDLKPTLWDHFTYQPLRTVSMSYGNYDNTIFVVTADSMIYCKGSNSYGQLGLGHCDEVNEFVKIDFLDKVIDIKCGCYETFLLTDKGEVWVAGQCSYVLGLGYDLDNSERNLNSVSNFTQLVFPDDAFITNIAVTYHAIALASDGKVYVWGSNKYFQLGIDSTTNQSVPMLITHLRHLNIVKISAGHNFSVFVDDKSNVLTCGNYMNEEIGSGMTITYENSPTITLPTRIKFSQKINIKSITSGDHYVVILTTNNKIYIIGKTFFSCQDLNMKGSMKPV